MPKIDIPDWQKHEGGAHPITWADCGPYRDKSLSKIAGLDKLGARIECLPPGSSSSVRHWHAQEDEFLLMLEGELVLVEDDETTLTAGDCAAWKAGVPLAHCLQNRSSSDASYLIVAANSARDVVHYPDQGIAFHRDETGECFTHTDGTPITTE